MRVAQLQNVWRHIREHGALEEFNSYQSYQEAAQAVKDGSLECYYDGARKFLQDLYEETDEEAEKYTNEEVWSQYVHVVALASCHKKYAWA